MKVIKIFLFSTLVLVLTFLVYFIFIQEQKEGNKINFDFNDQQIVQMAIDSITRSAKAVDKPIPINPVYSVQVEDFEANTLIKTDSIELQIFKSHQLLLSKTWLKFQVKNLICSDLNTNQKPEFWIFGTDSTGKFKIFAFEYNGNSFNLIKFPNLKGRQKFGYFGMDSLYFYKTDIVRSFHFKHDLYADIENGIRACYYSLGPDNSFILRKTIDFENE
jgi:hypothetical protein